MPRLQPLEKFLNDRMYQGYNHAMMIRRYLDNPSGWNGRNDYTEQDIVDFKADSEKCKAVLNFLKEYNKNTPK